MALEINTRDFMCPLFITPATPLKTRGGRWSHPPQWCQWPFPAHHRIDPFQTGTIFIHKQNKMSKYVGANEKQTSAVTSRKCRVLSDCFRIALLGLVLLYSIDFKGSIYYLLSSITIVVQFSIVFEERDVIPRASQQACVRDWGTLAGVQQ